MSDTVDKGFVFRKKNHTLKKGVTYKAKMDAAMFLLELGTVRSEGGRGSYQAADFDAMIALVLVNTLSTAKINFEVARETLYKVYDELRESGGIDYVRKFAAEDCALIYSSYGRLFEIYRGENAAQFDENQHKESFGVYAKEFIESFLGGNDMNAVVAEGTGLLDGMQKLFKEVRGIGGSTKTEDIIGEKPVAPGGGTLVNLSFRKDIEDPDEDLEDAASEEDNKEDNKEDE